MSSDQLKIQQLEQQVKTLTDFMNSFNNPAQIQPQHARTIQDIVGALRLVDLQDVTGTDAATNGQVLKYNGTTWAPGTDNTGA